MQYLRLYKKLQRCQQQISSIINSGILSFKCHRLDIFTFVTFCATLKKGMPYTACHLAIRVYGRLYGGMVLKIKQKLQSYWHLVCDIWKLYLLAFKCCKLYSNISVTFCVILKNAMTFWDNFRTDIEISGVLGRFSK